MIISSNQFYPDYQHTLWEAIHQNGGGCDYVTESIVNGSTFTNGKMMYGERSYDTLLMPEVETLDFETIMSLRAFVDTGGHIVFIGKKPFKSPLYKEMEQFIFWFNKVHNRNERLHILPLAKAGIAHLYFVCIHPFEDGNGRIGRAIVEKSLALSIQQPTLLSLSHTIESNKKKYYDSLERYNKTLDITGWLVYFSQTILDAQKNTLDLIDFTIEKTKMYDLFSSQLNERQTKVIKRLFDAGTSGFKGGLSADNYLKIAKTSASTATRDLKDLVDKKFLIKVGVLKSTRYLLNIKIHRNASEKLNI